MNHLLTCLLTYAAHPSTSLPSYIYIFQYLAHTRLLHVLHSYRCRGIIFKACLHHSHALQERYTENTCGWCRLNNRFRAEESFSRQNKSYAAETEDTMTALPMATTDAATVLFHWYYSHESQDHAIAVLSRTRDIIFPPFCVHAIILFNFSRILSV